MKKIILILTILIINTLLFCEASILDISSQSISISYYSESEYNLEYGTSTFSTGVDITSDTDDVTIYINEKNYTVDSLSLSNLDSGSYLIKIKKSGFNTIKKWITLDDDQRVVIEVELAREYGFLNIESNVENLELTIDDEYVENNQAIPTGSYLVTIKAFGYEEQIITVVIIESRTTSRSINLEEVAFEITKVSSDKKIFNPRAYEGFGKNRIKIDVNGPGDAILQLLSTKGIEVLNQPLTFTTWSTYYTLDQLLPDGLYVIKIISNEQSTMIEVEIDNELFLKNIPIYSGFPGLISVATAESNTVPIQTTSFTFNVDIAGKTIAIPFSFQAVLLEHLNLRAGMDFKIDLDGNYSEIDLFTGIKLSNNFKNLLYALNINYLFNSNQGTSDEIENSHSLIMNLPVTYNYNLLYFTIAPTYNYDFTNSSTLLGAGSGIHFDNQQYRLGLSGRINSDSDEELSYLYGLEGYYLLPDTQSFAGIAISSDEDLNISFSVNFSVLF